MLPDPGLGPITAVLVNWRTPESTIRAAAALIADDVPAERIVVVDNGSGGEDSERLARALPGCRHLALPAGAGFARAVNAGAAMLPASAAYLLVNSDAFVHRSGSVARLRDAVAVPAPGTTATAIAAPRLLHPDLTLQRSVVSFLGPASAIVRSSGLSRLIPDRWQPLLGTWWDHGDSRDVQSVTGAVLSVGAAAWHALGGFDERRAMYAEDHDLCRRAHAHGWRVRFVADAEFVHVGGASARRRFSEPERARRIATAEADVLREHLRPSARRVTLIALAAGAGARAFVRRVRGDREAAATQAAWATGYLAGLRPGPRPGAPAKAPAERLR